MRNICISFVLAFFFIPTLIVSMDPPAEEKTWTWEIFHIIDQWTDPLSYFTDTRASKVCDDVMRFGLDPSKPENKDKYREYTGDAQCLDDIKSALKRQRALLTALEAECLKNSDSKVELLRDAYERQPGYFSQNSLALIESYLKRAGKTALDTAHILSKQVGRTLDPVQVPQHLASIGVIDETRAITYQTIVNLVMGTPWLSIENGVNWLRKTWRDPLKYLNDEKAQNISLAMRHFHPRHRFHTEQWLFNNQLELHKRLIHQALERETRLTTAIQYAIEKEKSWMVVSLNPENPDNRFVMENIGSCYSPIARAAIKGFLRFKEKKQDGAITEQKQKEQYQKELAEKNQEVSTLLNSLGRKLSNAANAEKLKQLPEDQKSVYEIVKNSIAGRVITAQEVLDVHEKLTTLSRTVDQLLTATAQNAPSSSLTHSATTLPNFSPEKELLLERKGDILQMLRFIDQQLALFPEKLKLTSEEQALCDQANVSIKNKTISLDAIIKIFENLDVLINRIKTITPDTESEKRFASLQSLVDTAHMATSAAIPITLAVAATPLTSEAPQPLSVAPAASLEAGANTSLGSNPQASPRTPDGSPPTDSSELKKSDSEDFNPRGSENLVLPPTNPAQAKLAAALTPAPAKQQAAKNGKKNK